jgi:CelD/BcsL family acetyltransferase involved in cellulose biosynthesis
MSSSTTLYAGTECGIIHSLAADPRLPIEWNNLWARADGHYHESYTVCRHCWESIARVDGRELLCVTVWKGGKLVLVWPLVRYAQGPLRAIKPLTPSGGEANSLLVDPGTDVSQIVQCAWTAISNKTHGDVLNLPLIRVGSPLDQVVPKIAVNRFDRDAAPWARLGLESDWDSYRKALESDWDPYRKAIGARSLKYVARHRKRILEMGNARFFSIDPTEEPDQATRLIDWMLVEKHRWTARAHKSHTWVDSRQYRNFLVQSITDASEVLKYRIFAITLNNEPVAVKLIAICSGHVEYVIGAYSSDPQIAKLTPGLVLDEEWMRTVFDLGFDVDFGTGQEAYKLFWSKGYAEPLQTYRIPITLKGKIFLSAFNQLRKLRANANQTPDRKADAR